MKRLALLLVGLVTALFGATRVNLLDVRPLANAPASIYLLAVSSAGWIPVLLDPAGSVIIDLSVSPAVLRAPAGGPGTEVDDEFVAGVGQVTFTTSSVPKSRVRVFKNGLLQRAAFSDLVETTDPTTKRVAINLPGTQPGDGIVLSYTK